MRRCIGRLSGGVDDEASVTIEFPDGEATIALTWNGDERRNTIRLSGARGDDRRRGRHPACPRNARRVDPLRARAVCRVASRRLVCRDAARRSSPLSGILRWRGPPSRKRPSASRSSSRPTGTIPRSRRPRADVRHRAGHHGAPAPSVRRAAVFAVREPPALGAAASPRRVSAAVAAHNAFLEHADDRSLARRRPADASTGRIAAIDDRLHNDTHGEASTWFGFFEAENAETARALLAAVERRAGERRQHRACAGRRIPRSTRAPDCSIDGFDEDPYVLMPYNPPSYAGFVEAAGYGKVKDLLAWRIDMTRAAAGADRPPGRPRGQPARHHRAAARPRRVRARSRDPAGRSIATAWEDNWGFVPPTDAEIRQLAVELRPILDPEIVLFAETGGAAGRVRGRDSRREPGAEAHEGPAVPVRRCCTSCGAARSSTRRGCCCSASCRTCAASGFIRC